jgi:serine protease Do
MTGWVVAAATTAILGAAAVGPGAYGQSMRWLQGGDGLNLAVGEPQAVRILAGSGSQIGVTIRDLTAEDLKGKAGGSGGVAIEEVEADSPAAKAGFKAGDIVVEYDGERVRSTRQFARLVQETALGRQVQTAVLRDGQRVTMSVEPREGGSFKYFNRLDDLVTVTRPKLPPPPPAPPAKSLDMLPRIEKMFGAGRLGITMDDLSPQLAEYFGTKDGVLVKSVADNSVASKAGVKAGDVITALDGGTIDTAADLVRRVQRLESGDEFTLTIVRDKKTMTVKGKVEPSTVKRSTRTIL